MSIHVIQGKPGGGKSLYATRRVIQELVEGHRNIVTNLPIRLGNLNAYLQKQYPNEDFRAPQRVRILDDLEIRYFWKFRGPSDEAPPELRALEQVQDDDAKKPLLRALDAWAKTPSHGDGGKGVAFFLDEAHIPFNARAWASVATAALFYLSQHRKLGDVVWPITQSPGNLDKQFRSVAEDFTQVRNEYTAKFGPFRGRGRFVRRTYLAEPTAGSEPFETAVFTLDGVKDCYDTAKGIGVHGNKADIGRRAKGIPTWTLLPMAIGLGLLCIVIPWLLAKGTSKFMVGDTAKQQAALVSKITGQRVKTDAAPEAKPADLPPPGPAREAALAGQKLTPLAGAEVFEGVRPAVGPPPIAEDQRPAKPLTVRGYVTRGDKVNVVLSDGRTLTEGDRELQEVQRNGATVGGRKIWMSEISEGRVVEKAPKHVEQEYRPEKTPEYRGEAIGEPSPAEKLPSIMAGEGSSMSQGGGTRQIQRNGSGGGNLRGVTVETPMGQMGSRKR